MAKRATQQEQEQEQGAEGLEPFEPGTESPPPAAENKPQTSGYDPIATMSKAEEERLESEAKVREAAEVDSKSTSEEDKRKVVAYSVTHAVVGGYSKGDYVQADQLIPVPKGSTPEEAEKLRKDGIKRLVDLGAVTPIYEEE